MQTPRDLAESFGVLALLIVIAVLCEMLIPNWSSAASDCSRPGSSCPRSDRSRSSTSRRAIPTCWWATSVEIAAEIKNPEGKPHRARLFVTPESEPESPLLMTADEKHQRYKLTVPSVLKPLQVPLGDRRFADERLRIGVREKPVVEGVDVTFRYPAYLGRKSETVSQKGLDLEAPQYTVAELRLRCSTPDRQGLLGVGTRAISSAASRRAASCWCRRCRC